MSADKVAKQPHFLTNGRFLTRPLTGVDRIAVEICKSMSPEQGEGLLSPEVFSVAVPKSTHDTAVQQLKAIGVRARVAATGIGAGQVWEQSVLQFYRRKDMLLSLCNIGPIFRRNQFLMVADAQFVTQPQSYRFVFRVYFKMLLPIACRVSKHIATISEHSRDELEACGIFPKGKAHIVYCGSEHVLSCVPDDSVLTRLGVEKHQYLLMVGSLAPHKNMRFLIESVSGHLPPGARLVVAGGGNAKVFKDNAITAGDDVIFAGRVTDEELVALYAGARALVFPSLTEGFGLPPVEAMQWGCPVVASTGGAIPEVCGDAALFVEPDDAMGWIAAIERIWSDGALRQALSDAGRARASQFTWSNAANKILQVIGAGAARI